MHYIANVLQYDSDGCKGWYNDDERDVIWPKSLNVGHEENLLEEIYNKHHSHQETAPKEKLENYSFNGQHYSPRAPTSWRLPVAVPTPLHSSDLLLENSTHTISRSARTLTVKVPVLTNV